MFFLVFELSDVYYSGKLFCHIIIWNHNKIPLNWFMFYGYIIIILVDILYFDYIITDINQVPIKIFKKSITKIK